MVSALLPGGLGNIMFVIAASSALAWENKDKAVYCLSDHTGYKHNYPVQYKNTVFHKLNISKEIIQLPVYAYSEIKYKKIPYTKDIKLTGYYQNEKYFKTFSEKIKNLFEPTPQITNYINNKYKNLINTSTASIHVRRGDYLDFPDHHPLCSQEFYKEAISILPRLDNLLLFSDDIDWCKENLKFPINTHFIEEDETISLYLMASCDHNIIANSSFSWWGAWLNENPNKIIIGPKTWFGPKIKEAGEDICPISWIKI